MSDQAQVYTALVVLMVGSFYLGFTAKKTFRSVKALISLLKS
jgi:hypothetical protein